MNALVRACGGCKGRPGHEGARVKDLRKKGMRGVGRWRRRTSGLDGVRDQRSPSRTPALEMSPSATAPPTAQMMASGRPASFKALAPPDSPRKLRAAAALSLLLTLILFPASRRPFSPRNPNSLHRNLPIRVTILLSCPIPPREAVQDLATKAVRLRPVK